jgi:hypothetical protein
MPTTYNAAIDEMFGNANSVFVGTAASLLGYTPDVRWPGAPKANPPDKTKLWARVSFQVVTDDIAALANANGVCLYQTIGICFVQLFCPRNVGQSIDNGRLIAIALQAAFRTPVSSSGELWYSKSKIFELPEAEESYPITVSTRVQFKTTAPSTYIPPSPGGNGVTRYPLTFVSTGVYTVAVEVNANAILTRNGETLTQGSDYTVSGETITFAAGMIPNSGDSLQLFQ